MDDEINGTQQEAQAQQETSTQELQAPETGQSASQGVDATAYEAQIAERDARIGSSQARRGCSRAYENLRVL